MDEFIDSTVASIDSAVSTDYNMSQHEGVESLSIDDFELAQNAAIGFGSAGSCLILSLAIAGIIKILYRA